MNPRNLLAPALSLNRTCITIITATIFVLGCGVVLLWHYGVSMDQDCIQNFNALNTHLTVSASAVLFIAFVVSCWTHNDVQQGPCIVLHQTLRCLLLAYTGDDQIISHLIRFTLYFTGPSFALRTLCFLLNTFSIINAIFASIFNFISSPFTNLFRRKSNTSTPLHSADSKKHCTVDESEDSGSVYTGDEQADEIDGDEKDESWIKNDGSREDVNHGEGGGLVWKGGVLSDLMRDLADGAERDMNEWMRSYSLHIDLFGLRDQMFGSQLRRSFARYINNAMDFPLLPLADDGEVGNVALAQITTGSYYVSSAPVQLVVLDDDVDPASPSHAIISFRQVVSVIISADVIGCNPLIFIPDGSTVFLARKEDSDAHDENFLEWMGVLTEQGAVVEFVGEVDVLQLWEQMQSDAIDRSRTPSDAGSVELMGYIRGQRAGGSDGGEEDREQGVGENCGVKREAEEGSNDGVEEEEEVQRTSARNARGNAAGIFEDEFF